MHHDIYRDIYRTTLNVKPNQSKTQFERVVDIELN